MGYIRTKEGARRAFDKERKKQIPPELKSISTPGKIKRDLFNTEARLAAKDIRSATKREIGRKKVKGDLFIYEPDNLYEYLPQDIKDKSAEYDRQIAELLKDNSRMEKVEKLPDEEQIGLLSALVKSKERVEDYRAWIELVDKLEQNEVYQMLSEAFEEVRREVAEVFVNKGASVLFVENSPSMLGDSKGVLQRSRGWNALVGNSDLVAKINDVTEPANEERDILGSGKPSDFQPIELKGKHVVPELILPFKGRIMTLAPNLRNTPNLLEVFDELELRDRVKVVFDQMRGCLEFHKAGLHHLDARKPNVLVEKNIQTGEYSGRLNDSECASPTLGDGNFHPEGDEHDHFDRLIRNDIMPDEDKDNSPDRFLLTASLLECYMGKNFRKELYNEHFLKIFIKNEKHTLNNPEHHNADVILEEYFRNNIFPKSQHPIPEKIQNLLIRLYSLDYKQRPPLSEVIRVINDEYVFDKSLR